MPKEKGDAKNRRVNKVKFEISAGGIVFRKTRRGSDIAFILDPYKKWTFAKGHPKKGESLAACAKRETEEETGLKNLKMIEKLGKIDLWFWRKGFLIHKPVYYFLMMSPNERARMRPQRKEKIFKAAWIEIDKALAFSGYKNVRPLLKRAISEIKEKFV